MDGYETVYLFEEHMNFYEENIEQKLVDEGLAKRVVVMNVEEWMQMRGLKPDRYQNENGEETTRFEAGYSFSNSPADFELFGKTSTNLKDKNLFDTNKNGHEKKSLPRHFFTILCHLFDTVANFLGFLRKKSD